MKQLLGNDGNHWFSGLNKIFIKELLTYVTITLKLLGAFYWYKLVGKMILVIKMWQNLHQLSAELNAFNSAEVEIALIVTLNQHMIFHVITCR